MAEFHRNFWKKLGENWDNIELFMRALSEDSLFFAELN